MKGTLGPSARMPAAQGERRARAVKAKNPNPEAKVSTRSSSVEVAGARHHQQLRQQHLCKKQQAFAVQVLNTGHCTETSSGAQGLR